jgi:hypothetical protein
MDFVMTIEAALQREGLLNNEATAEEAPTAPLCYASTIRSNEHSCSKLVGKALRLASKDVFGGEKEKRPKEDYALYRYYCSPNCIQTHMNLIAKGSFWNVIRKTTPPRHNVPASEHSSPSSLSVGNGDDDE